MKGISMYSAEHNDSYRVATKYTGDGESTTIVIQIMIHNLGKWRIAHNFETPLEDLDCFANYLRRIILDHPGSGTEADSYDGRSVSVTKEEDMIVFRGPVTAMNVLAAPMTIANACLLVEKLDAVKDTIQSCLRVGVEFIESGEEACPEQYFNPGRTVFTKVITGDHCESITDTRY
jgi:hypothetical protein